MEAHILPPPEERMDPRTEQALVELRVVLSMLWKIVRGEGPTHEAR